MNLIRKKNQKSTLHEPPTNLRKELYNSFDKTIHLQPTFDRIIWDTLHGWEFAWAVIDETINNSKSKDEVLLAKRLSPGQKALHFLWYLDAQVTNGGFIQFYWNGYGKYLPPIIDALNLIGDTQILELVNKAEKEFKSNIKFFRTQKKIDDWEPLYEELKTFDELDTNYYETHDKMVELIEIYARKNPAEFVKFR